MLLPHSITLSRGHHGLGTILPKGFLNIVIKTLINPVQVIREGRPCHLYFDLEYVQACNPTANGDALVDVLLDLIEVKLR